MEFPRASIHGDVHSTMHEGMLYDVYKIIAYSELLPIIEVPLSELVIYLEEPCWIKDGEEGVSISPNMIIQAFREAGSWDVLQELYPDLSNHARKIQNADYSHPIILGPGGYVMDGKHRLAKAFIDGEQTIKARKLDKVPEEAILDKNLI